MSLGSRTSVSDPTENALFVAISTRSHLGATSRLAKALRTCHPNVPIAVLLVDSFDPLQRRLIATELGVDLLLAPEDILHVRDFAALRTRYNVRELCFACKPLVLRKLLQQGCSAAIYLDSDIEVYAPLTPMLARFADSSVLLTPHLTSALPEDHKLPRDITILRAGAFNLGCIGVRNDDEGRRFLDWWAERVTRYGYSDPYRAWGADQKWCDLVPALFDRVAILKHPGLNVSYWNLPSRPLSKENGKWYAGGEPLVFFHFSGFDPAKPHVLSRFQDRIDPAKDPLLTELLTDYATRLVEAKGELEPLLATFPDDQGKTSPPQVDQHVADALTPAQYATTITVRPTRLVVEPGEIALVQVVISNSGSSPLWIVRHSDGIRGIGLSFHLSRASGEMLAWDNPRQYFADPVPAHGSAAYECWFRMPLDPGQFILEIDLVHDGHAWFGARGGSTATLEVFAGVQGGAK